MLIELRIENIALIKQATIQFSPHLTIITGETGAGKTLILKSIFALFGEKMWSQEEPSRIEALFSISKKCHLFLEEKGFSLDPAELLSIKRVVRDDGKARYYINEQFSSKETMQKLRYYLFSSIDAASSRSLIHQETLRELLDNFLGLEHIVATLKKVLSYREVTYEIENLEALQKKDLAYLYAQEQELSIIPENISAYESMVAAHEQQLLIEEQQNAYWEIQKIIEQSTLPAIQQYCSFIQKNLRKGYVDTSIGEKSQNLLSELQSINGYIYKKTENIPEINESLETTISAIESLRRKYKSSIEELIEKKDRIREEIGVLETVEERLDIAPKKSAAAYAVVAEVATQLSTERKKGAALYTSIIEEKTRALNIPEFRLQIIFHPVAIGIYGQDEIEWLVQTNTEHGFRPIRQIASSGELSRILLASLLSIPGNTEALLLLDEIDANIGGETATLIGKNLKEYAKQRQIIGISHFPQVASHADLHIGVTKENNTTNIMNLSGKQREKELLRMLGGTLPLTASI